MSQNTVEVLLKARDEMSGALSKVNEILKTTAKETAKVGNSINDIGNKIPQTTSRLSSSFSSLGSSLAGLSKTLGQTVIDIGKQAAGFIMAEVAIKGFNMAIYTGKEMFIDYNARMESSRMAFENLLKSAAAADYFIGKLQKFSRETPFEFPDLQAASKMMLGLGWAARDILPALTAVGNAMAATGTSGAEMTNVIMSISQMKGAGMLDAQNLKELDKRGLAATQILTNHFKMSVEQIQKSGKDIDEIIGVLVKGMNEKFAGAMDKQKGTWNQLTSNLGDEWGQIAGELGTPVFNMFKDTLVEAETWSGKFLEIMQTEGLKSAIEKMVPKNVQDVFKNLYNGTDALKTGFFDLAMEITGTKTASAAFASSANTVIEGMGGIATAAATAAREVANFSYNLGAGLSGGAARKDASGFFDTMFDTAGDIYGYFDTGKYRDQWDETNAKIDQQNIKNRIKLTVISSEGVFEPYKFKKTAEESKYAIVDSITKNINDISNAVSSTWAVAQKKWDETTPYDKWLWRNSGKGNAGSGEADFNKNTGAPKMKIGDSSGGSSKGRGNKHIMDFDEIIEREREAMASLQTEAKLATAKMVGDKKWQAETEYEIAISNIEKEYFRKQEIVKGNFEAEAALQKWHHAKSLEAFQEKENKQKDIELEAFDKRIEQNSLLFDLDKATKEEVSQSNRQALDEKIKVLQTELAVATLTQEREIELQTKLADAKKKALVLPQNEQEAFYSGIKQQTDTWNTYFQDIQNIGKAAAQGLNDAFSNFFFDALTGQMKSFGDYLKSFWQGIAKAISQTLANAFANKIISSLLGNILGSGSSMPAGLSPGVSNGFKYRASGGSINPYDAYIVGEKGPELFVSQHAGNIIPNQALRSASAAVNTSPTIVTQPSISVNIQNNTGTPVEAKADVKFDGQRQIVTIMLDAINRDVMGIKTIIKGMVKA